MHDLAHAVRRLVRRPASVAVATATLAVGIGAATALFSVAHAVMQRPLPYARPDRLVMLWQQDLERGQPFVEMSYPAFRDWRAANPVFEDLAGLPSTNQSWTLTGRGEPVELTGRLVSWSFFQVLGVPPALGRTLTPDDDRRGAARVVVLGHDLWRSRFGADPRVVGTAIVLDGEPFTVVGVMPRGFAHPAGAELWTPVVPGIPELAEQPGVFWMSAIGRLKAGVSLEQARRDMRAFATRYNRDKYQAPGITAVVTPLQEVVLGLARPTLLALLAGTGLVLLVACASVAALQLVQVEERGPELALRAALGASGARLVRGLLAESAVLGVLGGGLGTLATLAGVPALVALSPAEVPRLGEATLDPVALAFALAVTLLTVAATALAVSTALGIPRFAAGVLSAFGLVAVLLAALGLYGLVAYSVSRRAREIGVRVALGARPVHVARLVLGDGLRPAVAGVVLGLAGALLASRLLSKLLFGIGPTDAPTLIGASALLVAVAASATAVAARLAFRIEPAAILREP